MQHLIAVGFPRLHRAPEVLRKVHALAAWGTFDLADAIAVHRTMGGRLHVDRRIGATRTDGAAVGGLFGAILGGALDAPHPATSTAVAATAGGAGLSHPGDVEAIVRATEATEWHAQPGVRHEFVQEILGLVQPGTSAIFALVESDEDPVCIARRFQGYGGTLLHMTLSGRPGDSSTAIDRCAESGRSAPSRHQ